MADNNPYYRPGTATDRASAAEPPNSGSTTRTIFPKGPIFSLDNFSNRDFIVKDFIESLTESALPSSRRSLGPGVPNPFDAKPLIRAFEQASRRLNELSSELEVKETELSAAVRRAESQHFNNTQKSDYQLQTTIDRFKKLDEHLNSEGAKYGGGPAIEIGHRLEELDRQRRRANDAHFLIECWDEVSNRGEVTMLENLRRSGTGEGKIRSAQIAKQLLRISQRLDGHNHDVNGKRETNGVDANGVNGETNGTIHKSFSTREVIEKFIETLENDMLKLFDDFYRRQNFEEMKNCAIVLQDFNGGASVQAAFVNQHQFFIDRSNLVTDELSWDAETWVRLSDPDAELPGIEPGLQSLIDEVRVVVQEESTIIKRAFPYPEQVLGKFVQRVFQQSIQQRLELVLEKAESESTLAYLRTLQATRSSINTLVDDLKAHGLTEHPDPITTQTSTLLDQQVDELFTPYFGGSAYIDKERQNLRELYKSLLFKFELFHSRRRKEPKTYLASLRNRGQELLSAAREATDQYVNRLDIEKMSSTQKRILLSVAGLKNTDKAQPDLEISELDGRLQVAFAKRMLKWLAEGVRRGLELSGGAETPKDVAALHSLLLQTVGQSYIEIALDATLEASQTAENAKKEQPDLTYLMQLKPATNIMHLLQSCINTLLVPLASTSLTVRRDMEKAARTTLLRLEDQINTIELRTVDAVSNWTARLLSLQSRTDFRPRDDLDGSSLITSSSTPTAASVIRFLDSFQQLASGTFDGATANLTLLLTEVATDFRSQLLDHFKKWQVNELGAVMLVRDISAYIDLLKSWDLDNNMSATSAGKNTNGHGGSSGGTGGKGSGGAGSFNASLEVLAEIGGLFVLRPEALRDRLVRGSSTVLAGVGRENLRPYLVRREDYLEVGMQSLLHSL